MKTAAQIMKNRQAVKQELDARMPKAESDALWDKAERRLEGIMRQYAGIPKGERIHTDHYIFPSAAIYLTVKEATDAKSAYAVIENAAIRNSAEVGRKLAGLMKLPGMKSLFIKAWDPLVRKIFGSDSGFRNVFYPKKKGEYRMDILACPYNRYFTELGCPELTKIFCANDERCYGNLPGLEFRRTGTLGTGADRCDFSLRKR